MTVQFNDVGPQRLSWVTDVPNLSELQLLRNIERHRIFSNMRTVRLKWKNGDAAQIEKDGIEVGNVRVVR